MAAGTWLGGAAVGSGMRLATSRWGNNRAAGAISSGLFSYAGMPSFAQRGIAGGVIGGGASLFSDDVSMTTGIGAGVGIGMGSVPGMRFARSNFNADGARRAYGYLSSMGAASASFIGNSYSRAANAIRGMRG